MSAAWKGCFGGLFHLPVRHHLRLRERVSDLNDRWMGISHPWWGRPDRTEQAYDQRQRNQPPDIVAAQKMPRYMPSSQFT